MRRWTTARRSSPVRQEGNAEKVVGRRLIRHQEAGAPGRLQHQAQIRRLLGHQCRQHVELGHQRRALAKLGQQLERLGAALLVGQHAHPLHLRLHAGQRGRCDQRGGCRADIRAPAGARSGRATGHLDPRIGCRALIQQRSVNRDRDQAQIGTGRGS